MKHSLPRGFSGNRLIPSLPRVAERRAGRQAHELEVVSLLPTDMTHIFMTKLLVGFFPSNPSP